MSITTTAFFKKFPEAPYLISKNVRRVPNPSLSQTVVTKEGKLALARAAANYVYPIAVPIPNLVYEAPVLFDKAGTYLLENRNIRSTDNTAAVRVWNGAIVEIRNCTLVSCGNVIEASGNATLNIHHNNLYGDKPINNGQWGRALNMYHPTGLTFENNYCEHTGGILLDHTETGAKPIVNIRYNKIRNTDKRKTDLSDGDHRAAILFNTVLPVSGEISWNIFENEIGISHIEDNINLYNSGGTEALPFLIHDNLVYGAYPYPLTATYYTGSGITIDGDPGTNQLSNMSQWVNIYKNTIVSTCNACMNIAAGHDIHSYENFYISSGMFPDATSSQRFWGGCCIWDGSNVGANFKNNDQKRNTIGYVRPDVSVPFAGRQDWVVVANNPLSIKAGDNTSLPNPITLDTEKSYIDKYNAAVIAGGKKIGNVSGTQPPDTSDFQCKVGDELSFNVQAADDNDTITSFKTETLTASSDSFSKTSFVAQTLFVDAISAGRSKVTVSLHSNADKVITKDFYVMITEKLPEATRILITQTNKK